jgi:type II secretory pathway pseudopilin PulG
MWSILPGNQRGSAYLVVMFAVVVMSISITAAAKQWKTVVQREKEADLLARGIEIQTAIGFYWQKLKLAGVVNGGYPLTLEQLTKGPKPFLRKVYKDPMTGEDWEYVRDPATGGIRGVRSRAKTAPIKQQEFPQQVFHFAGLKRYYDWVFQYPSTSIPQSPLALPTQQNPLVPKAQETQQEGQGTSSAPPGQSPTGSNPGQPPPTEPAPAQLPGSAPVTP